MKLTKKLESEIKQVMEDYWASYFKGDLVTWSHFLPDDYRNIGSTAEEVWNSKEEMLEYSKAVVPHMLGTVEIRNKRLEIIPLEPYFMVHEFVDMFINTGGEWVFYSKFRLSSIIQKTDAGWKVIHQHGSVPDSKAQTGESIGFQKISKENLELREAVKRRTVELEYKNHELEIETSLERVRTVAMSMKKPNDLLNIGEMLFRELKILGFSELRNALINTFVDEENYFTDYDYSDLTGGSITRIPYSGHPVIENYIRNLRKDNDAFTEQIVTGKELEQWKEFRRSNGEADDPRLDNIAAVYYYVYSVGAGGIGISTLSSISEEKLKVLKRFSNVFDLAYKRYTDITKAETQSREAQVELALERVRARTMAMQRSDELADVATILFQQVKALGVPQWLCGFSIWEIGDKEFTWYPGSPDGEILPPCKIPLTEHPVFISFDESRRRGDELFVYEKAGEFQGDHYRYMQSLPGLRELLQNMLDAGLSFPAFQIDHIANFSHGNLAFITYEHFPEMHDIFKRFAKVFDQTYTRFLDLQKAEAQAREAKIENALEKVRSRSLAMHKSDELEEVVHTVFDKLKELEVELYTAIIFIFAEGSKDIIWWLENKVSQHYARMLVPYDDNPYLKDIFETREKGNDFFSATYSLKEKNELFHHLFENTDFKYVPEEQKQFLLESELATMSVALAKNTGINITSYTKKAFSENENEILRRFGKVFEQAYTRFLDLQKAEAQAREAQIEAALERVRSRTMGMQKSTELGEVSHVINEQLQQLNFKNYVAGFLMDYRDSDDFNVCRSDASGLLLEKTSIPYFDHPIFNRFIHAKETGLDFYDVCLTFEEKNKWVDHALPYFQAAPQEVKEILYSSAGYASSCALLKNVGLFIENFDGIPFSKEENDILMRFGKVFEQTYIRFLDLQKAEAQAREARIEAALEKVRSKTMAMHQSPELQYVIEETTNQLHHLGFKADSTNFLIKHDIHKDPDMHLWLGVSGSHGYYKKIDVPYFDHPMFSRTYEAMDKGEELIADTFSYEEKNIFYRHIYEHTVLKDIPEERKNYVLHSKGMARSTVISKNSALTIINYDCTPYTPEENGILKRMAHVFDQAYTRFLDLEKAEAQSREAQIEVSLERVRSKAMAMQKSEDLADAVAIVFEELDKLNLGMLRCGIGILNKEKRSADLWTTTKSDNDTVVQVSGDESMDIHPLLHGAFEAWLNQVDYSYVLKGEDLNNYYKALTRVNFKLPDSQSLVTGAEGVEQYYFNAVFSSGGLFAFRETEFPDEAKIILKRFADVFHLTYTRFNDLKQAEAQAREAQFQLSLERVRARTMAMHHSNELAETASVLFQQIKELDFETWSCGFCIWTKNDLAELWMGADSGGLLPPMMIPYKEEPTHRDIHEASLRGESAHEQVWEGEALAEHYAFLKTIPSVREAIEILESSGLTLPARQCYYVGFFKQGYLLLITKEPNADLKELSKRFAQVFDLTYTRFLDLQKAEIQAREATIEGALERVRSRTLAMQKSDELAETAAVLFRQLILLGIAPNRLYICIIKDDSGQVEFWVTDEDGSRISKRFTGDANRNASMKQMHDVWKGGKKSLTIDMQGEELQNYFHYLADELHVPFKVGLTQKRRIQSIAYFSRGFIGIASPDEQPAETVSLLERFASVFNLTYTRFNDLKIAEAHAEQAELDLLKLKEEKKRTEDALAELQVTQKQLIQAEKMASLGELTAGIAHEIQNPLNFVNNFSDLSKELLDEMKTELNNGNTENARDIANDVIINLEKINHHGKRADAIVKGMLQHSRSNSGQMESTDINALTDEYIRLAYHGMRAKNKSFNAKLEATFDNTIGAISIIPQDIGRVILNLINNAFYAVDEKKKSGTENYEPTVAITTKKLNGKVFISVHDNGNGIAPKVLDKIFQPFFTTKPPGQGTGLGLSLAYDIIKAHGGELEVETKEGVGSGFMIEIPV